MPDQHLYFAYSALLSPNRMNSVAPGASFQFVAHYPETKLTFVANGKGSVPSLARAEGHTVWGAVFRIPDEEIAAVTAAEESEGRHPSWTDRAVDRGGNKHHCLTFVAGDGATETKPSPEYLDQVIEGARHWSLPAGWVVGLEDLTQDSPFD